MPSFEVGTAAPTRPAHAPVAVVHLVRAGNPPEALARFVQSYRRFPAGIDHELVVLFKGFASAEAKAESVRALDGIPFSAMDVSDDGFDITAYQKAVAAFPHDFLFFCNSYTVLLDSDWLLKCHRLAAAEDVGIVGCTGSYQSNYQAFVWNFLEYVQRLRDVRQAQTGGGAPAWRGWPAAISSMPPKRRWRYLIAAPVVAQYVRTKWPPYPNYHVRTNAFMLPREIARRVRWPATSTKMDSYQFESGRRSLTRQIRAMGKHAVLVGRDGERYDEDAWLRSNTFWCGDQGNLLVADNQTQDYADGDADRREYLRFHAWGPRPSDSGQNR